jgi:hypothetical protein
MSIYIDSRGLLHHDNDSTLALNCPHCQVLAQIIPIAVPWFDELQRNTPKSVGVVYRCSACNSAIFLRYPIRSVSPERIELSAQFEEVERLEERFSYTHLPDEVALLFREALGCFTDGHCNAFASMCRRTIRAAQQDMPDGQRQSMSEQLLEGLRIAEIDGALATDIRRIVFGSDADAYPNLPHADATTAGALVELMKDLLYQTYVRPRRLRQSLQIRRFFSEERDRVGNLAVD